MTRPGKCGRSPITEGLAGAPLEYCERLDWHNRLFNDDIMIEAVTGEITSMRIVSSQHHVVGTQDVTQEEINLYFERRHFVKVQWHSETPWFVHDTANLIIKDGHPSNFMRNVEGQIRPTDVVIGRLK
jgi:hypothetical protein